MESERIYLRAFIADDLQLINKLHNDYENNKYTGGNIRFVSEQYDEKWLEDKMINNQHQLYLMVCLKENNETIGYTSLSEIDHWNKSAFLSGYTIVEKYQNKGYATEAVKLLITYAFEELNMNRIESTWLDDNDKSISVGEKLGFKREGVLRDYVYKTGRYHEVIIGSILKQEYDQMIKKW